ncbi:unnamed protein product [Brassica rapa subsp. trilocularis]
MTKSLSHLYLSPGGFNSKISRFQFIVVINHLLLRRSSDQISAYDWLIGMALKRGLSGVNRIRGGGSRSALVILVFLCVFAPLFLFVGRGVYTSIPLTIMQMLL